MTTSRTSSSAVIPGEPETIRALASRLRGMTGGLEDAATALAAITSGDWHGRAGDAFRTILHDQPQEFRRGAHAFMAAERACLSYAAVLERAQGTAGRAVDQQQTAVAASRAWQAHSAAYAALATRAAGGDLGAVQQLAGAVVPPCHDPGYAGAVEAERILAECRDEVLTAGRRAAAVLAEAGRSAPNKPGIVARLVHWSSEFGKGFSDSVVGMGDFVCTYSLIRLAIDPAGWSADVVALGRGLVYGAAHPIDFGKTIIDWDTFQESPARWLGSLGPDALLALATAGAGTAATGTVRATRVTTTLRRAGTVAGEISAATKGSDVVGAGEDLRRLDQLRSDLRSGFAHPGRRAR